MDVQSPRESGAVKHILLSELDRLTSQLRAMGEEAQKIRESEGSRPGFGKRVGDYTTEVLEQANNRAVARNLTRTVEELKRALQKLENGTYGLCDVCGRPIGAERLEALPSATLCIDCKRKKERR